MHRPDVARIAEQSKAKASFLDGTPGGYLILSILAGAYLGFGITLIISVGAPFAAEGAAAQKLVMGAAFGLALAVVMFAGSELFTGNNMTCAIGALEGALTWWTVGRLWLVSLAGNLVGSLGLAWLVAQSGVLSPVPQHDLLVKIASMKMSLPAWDLFVRGLLCNWLVCLALWTAGRMSSETGKIIMISWCLLAFVGSGFEHSIANQSLLGMALFSPHPTSITWNGFFWNQAAVIAGNLVGGGVCVGGLYWLAARSSPARTASQERQAGLLPSQVLSNIP